MIQTPITFLLPDLAGGGAQRVMLQVAGALDPARFAPRLLVTGSTGVLGTDVPPHVAVEFGHAPRLRQGLPWLVRRLRVAKPAVVVSVMGYLNLALLAARPLLPRGTRIVVREANVLAATTAELPRWLPATRAYRHLYGSADAVVSPTQAIADEIIRAAPNARPRVSVIANPVDVDGLRARAGQPRRAPGAGLRLVAAGRLTRQKGFDRLVELFPLLPPTTHLTIFGDGPERPQLENRIAALGLVGRVELAGFSRDLPAWIAGADAFVLPSRWEGLPNVVLEALALGTPTVASDEAAVGDVAQAAAPGALTVAPFGPAFTVPLLRAQVAFATTPGYIRQTLLPDAYLAATVAARWEALLAELASTATR